MIKTLFKVVLVVFLVNTCPSNLLATLIIPPDNMEMMIEHCDIIVYGQVVSHSDQFGTINNFKILNSFKGNLKNLEVIQLKEERLRTATTIVEVNGDVDFKIGSRYLLFLFQDGSRFYRPHLLSLSVYEEMLIENKAQLIHTASLLDICFLGDLDDSLIGSYDRNDMIRSLHKSTTSWNFKSAGFKGEIPNNIQNNRAHHGSRKSLSCVAPSHCTTLIGDPADLNTSCNLGSNPSPAKHQDTNFQVIIASGAQSDPSTPNEIANLTTAVNELNNINGITLSLASPLVQTCATNTQSSVANLVQVVCNPFSDNEIWVFFDDPYNEINDLTPPCNGIVGKGGTRASTPCHVDACGNQWLSAQQAYFFMNNGAGCLSDYKYTATIIHEMMHSLNLNHINGTCTAIMNAGICNANDPNAPNFGITQLDRDCVEWMYNQCPANVNLSNVAYNSDETVSVQNWIESQNITINSNADIQYNAGQYVEINPLFEVKFGAIFHALIAGCTP